MLFFIQKPIWSSLGPLRCATSACTRTRVATDTEKRRKGKMLKSVDPGERTFCKRLSSLEGKRFEMLAPECKQLPLRLAYPGCWWESMGAEAETASLNIEEKKRESTVLSGRRARSLRLWSDNNAASCFCRRPWQSGHRRQPDSRHPSYRRPRASSFA